MLDPPHPSRTFRAAALGDWKVFCARNFFSLFLSCQKFSRRSRKVEKGGLTGSLRVEKDVTEFHHARLLSFLDGVRHLSSPHLHERPARRGRPRREDLQGCHCGLKEGRSNMLRPGLPTAARQILINDLSVQGVPKRLVSQVTFTVQKPTKWPLKDTVSEVDRQMDRGPVGEVDGYTWCPLFGRFSCFWQPKNAFYCSKIHFSSKWMLQTRAAASVSSAVVVKIFFF